MPLSDIFVFLREWIRSPRGVAAVVPSTRALALLITKEISSRTGKVLELGPGTGSFTQALIERGVREEDLVLVEYSAEFAQLLKSRFRKAHIEQLDAEKLSGIPPLEAGAVICGLGLLNMSEQKVAAIIQGAFGHLRPGGSLYLFTYGSGCSVPPGVLRDLDLSAERVGKTYLNIPPASVYRIARTPSER